VSSVKGGVDADVCRRRLGPLLGALSLEGQRSRVTVDHSTGEALPAPLSVPLPFAPENVPVPPVTSQCPVSELRQFRSSSWTRLLNRTGAYKK